MKKFIIRLISFLFIAIFFYILVLLAWNRFGFKKIKSNLNYRVAQGGHLFTRLREVENFGEIDVLVVGSSHAYRGFDPRVFQRNNLKMFNLGSSAQSPIQSELLLKRYLGKLKPKLVVMEVFPGSLTSDGIESSLDLISNSISLDYLTFNLVVKNQNLKVWNTYIVSLIYQLFDLNDNLVEGEKKGFDTYISGGYVENKSLNQNLCENSVSFNSFNDEQLAAINRIEQYLLNEDIKLLFVSAPVTQTFFHLHPEYEAFYKYFNNKGNYLDYSQLKVFKEKYHFIDCDHLNAYGTVQFNELLMNSVISLFNKHD